MLQISVLIQVLNSNIWRIRSFILTLGNLIVSQYMEKLMQYVWQNRLWTPEQMVTTDGRRISVIDPGWINNDAGPDFYNAKICMNSQIWAGNIEIHFRATDWHRHGHDSDPRYDNVILHVVCINDGIITRSDGSIIPQLHMPCARDFRERFLDLCYAADALPCKNELQLLPQVYLTDCITAMSFERLDSRADLIKTRFREGGSLWTEAVYRTLAYALGFKTNSEPFEILCRAVPLRWLLRLRGSELSIEALLLGQAGLLTDPAQNIVDSHLLELRKEFEFLKSKYNLKPMSPSMWKLSRMRPANFPHRRIAALAAFIANGFSLASEVLNVSDVESARKLFSIELSEYWQHHYNFNAVSNKSLATLSEKSVELLIINVVVPLQYAYADMFGHPELRERALQLLEQIPPEINHITISFSEAGVKLHDAFTTQGLLQLRRKYCEQRQCLACRLGHRILAQRVHPSWTAPGK